MPEVTPNQNGSILPNASSNIEQAFYDVSYAVTHVGLSCKGLKARVNTERGLADIAVVQERLKALEALLIAEAAGRAAPVVVGGQDHKAA